MSVCRFWTARLAPLAAGATMLVLGACSVTPPASPELMARCAKLYGLWYRYEQNATLHHSGQRARAELALHRCEQGRYAEGIPELEQMLRRGRIAVPPA